MIAFAHRNFKIFFRDRSAVFFSLLSSLIIVGLYVLFLGDVYVGNFPNVSNARELLDNWVMAGLLATTAVTGGIGAFSVKIDDRARKIEKDFLSSPVARAHLDAGYLLGALVVDILLCLFTLLLAEAYIVLNGGRWLSFPVLCRLLMMIVAACVAGVCLVFCLASLLKSPSAFSAAATVTGTLIGFLTEIYPPIGALPAPVQWIIRLFPISHAAALFRQIMMQIPLEAAFSGAPVEAKEKFELALGIRFQFGESHLSPAGNPGHPAGKRSRVFCPGRPARIAPPQVENRPGGKTPSGANLGKSAYASPKNSSSVKSASRMRVAASTPTYR